MAFRVENGGEPIPGYRLLERLGGGGFGEVWKVEAPGGIHKAIKLVFGNLQTSGEDEVRAKQELKALNRVKTVRHPYILSLERYDIIDGQLLIVMELADRNLWDRFRECRTQGLMGIPREELLRYMDESAEALDLMNLQYNLQHLDIKPQNIFLIYNHIKVADFGLVKDLEGMRAVVTGGITPVYAAPETFDGDVTRYCDQYSLGIVYHELLTGRRPFAGTNVQQLIMQHLTAEPNLELLSPGDREAIARSLQKKPEDRFPSCGDLAKALRQGSSAPAVPTSTSAVRPNHTTAPDPTTPAGPVNVPTTGAAAALKNLLASGGRSATSSGTSTLAPAERRPETVTNAQPVTFTSTLGDHIATEEKTHPPIQAQPEVTGEGVLFPALIIGVGGVGRSVLDKLRAAIGERHTPAQLPQLRFLYLDTDPEAVRDLPATADKGLSQADVLLTRLNRQMHYLKHVPGRIRLDTWLDTKMIYRIPRQQVTTGMRALGRLAFMDNYRTIVNRVQAELEACTDADALDKAVHQTRLGFRSNRPRVYVVAGLGGGTGSGMFIDLGYVLRHVLKQFGFEKPEIHGFLLAPSGDPNSQRSTLSQANTFAALAELNHFSAADVTFSAHYDENERPLKDREPPLTRCYVLPLPNEENDAEMSAALPIAQVAEFLCRELTTPLGRALDSARAVVAPPSAALKAGKDPVPFQFQSFGLSRYTWPRKAMLRLTARGLGARLVTSWTVKERVAVREPARILADKEWADLELDPTYYVEHLHLACGESLGGKPPESAFVEVLGPLETAARPTSTFLFKRTPDLAPDAVLETLDRFELLLGRPEGSSPSSTRRPATLPDALPKAAWPLAAVCEKKIATLVERSLEKPGFRLAGVEEMLTNFMGRMDAARARYDESSLDLATQAGEMFEQIYELIGMLQSAIGTGQRTNALTPKVIELMRSYPKLRYQGLVAKQVMQICGRLQTFLSDQLREVDFVRNRLYEILRSLEAGRSGQSEGTQFGRSLLPEGATTLDEAVEQLLAGFNDQHVKTLDSKVQATITAQFTNLQHVSQSSGTLLKNLEKAIEHEAETLAGTRLVDTDLVELFLQHYTRYDDAVASLRRVYQEAAPALAGDDFGQRTEIRVLAAPNGPDTERFREMVESALPNANLTPASSFEDIVFYRELLNLKMQDLEQVNDTTQEVYQRIMTSQDFTPHTRLDVGDWHEIKPGR